MRTIDKILCKVNTQYGAPMGRNNIGEYPHTITSGKSCKIYKKYQKKVFDCAVNLYSGYDKGVHIGEALTIYG